MNIVIATVNVTPVYTGIAAAFKKAVSSKR